MNVQIMRLINTLKVGRNGTSCLVPVVREFSNVRIPDYQFFSLVFLPLFQDGALLSSHGICCCLNDTILNNPTYLLIHQTRTQVSLLRPLPFHLFILCLICVMDMDTCKTVDLKKHIIIVHDENLSNVQFKICDKIFEIRFFILYFLLNIVDS